MCALLNGCASVVVVVAVGASWVTYISGEGGALFENLVQVGKDSEFEKLVQVVMRGYLCRRCPLGYGNRLDDWPSLSISHDGTSCQDATERTRTSRGACVGGPSWI